MDYPEHNGDRTEDSDTERVQRAEHEVLTEDADWSPSTLSPSAKVTARMLLAALVSPAPYIGLLFAILVIAGGGIGGGASVWHVLLALTFIGLGPTAISLSLSFSLRGLGGGALAMLSIIITYPLAEAIGYLVPRSFQGSVSWGLIGAVAIAVASATTGYLRNRRGYLGLMAGLTVGVILAAVFVTSYVPATYRGDLLDPRLVLEWSAPFAFSWTSIILFPELIRHRVSWLGFLIWAGLQGSIFGLGVLVSQFWVG